MKTQNKFANHILLSSITASLLFSPLMALPSGGKFTHGTSGTINVNGNNMHIHGNKVNSVIQWGGGFNINHGETVNFNGSNKNYLNIAQGTNKSTIAGLLNASGNNVFLINPNGVIITKTGVINANRFVASTSSMDTKELSSFANMKNFSDGLTFSPVFKPNKAGNVINMGNINTNDVLLIGNKVDVQGGNLGNSDSKTHLVGNYVYVDVDSANLNSKIYVTALKDVYMQQQMINFAQDNYNFGNNVQINNIDYIDNSDIKHQGKFNFKKLLTIGNMGDAKDNAIEWWYFAKGWNEGIGDIRSVDEFRLVSDIDFNGNKGVGVEGRDWKNYVNYCIDGLGCTSMVIGSEYGDEFTKIFDGQGYALKNININIDSDKLDFRPDYVGIFGKVNKAVFKNINIDYRGGGIQKRPTYYDEESIYIGGFIGYSENVILSNIFLSNIGKIDNHINTGSYVGGFVGYSNNDKYSNVSLNDIISIASSNNIGNGDTYSGGFAGFIKNGAYSNIFINSIGRISDSSEKSSYSGGFAGSIEDGVYSNIYLNNIDNIYSIGKDHSYSGGFFGEGNFGTFFDISLNNIEGIYSIGSSSYSGGFVGKSIFSIHSNISLNNITNIHSKGQSAYSGGFVGVIFGQNNGFSNIVLNDIANIYSYGDHAFSGGFAGYLDSSKADFSNIFIYFNPNSTIGTNNENVNSNIFVNTKYYTNNIIFSNVHIYHKEGELANIISDKNNLNDTDNKIKIYTYTDDKQGYIDFEKAVLQSLAKEGLHKDKNGNLVFTKEFKIEKPSNILTLEKDDVVSADDLNKWLDEIFAGNYWVDIKDFDKIQGLSESMAQSISFLEAFYGQEGMKEILNKFGDDYKKAYPKFDKLKTSKVNLLTFINDKLKVLVNTSNEMLTELKITQDQLNIAIKSYNEYAKKINENPSLKNEETLNALKAEVERLDKLSQELAIAIASNQLKLENWQNKTHSDSKGQFTIKGKFEHAALLVPDLEEVVTNGNENNSYQKISRQIADTNKQTPAFEFEYEKLAEVEEASLKQTSRTCIVSDNFKTMNPCVVGSF
ncbi:two-partner secretion domain-containing protein [Campylobacter volucris]|uniref:two-partner secretion domain-containing protein n=1 Tax=Campylobacter volucris TaxID=1031542 RepID=UPI0018A08F37|nr:filamentous hemagglutinin N-terminal domain-containing protein [Campylobacter volucris]MBF7044866.1 filamentous hemagglutinin N-terminal domain-containing protein [Campylobacter volucris]